MVQNKAFIYKAVPVGWPKPGQDLAIESTDFDLSAAPPPGGFTTKNLYAAFDPSQRGRMRDLSIKSYSPPMEPGKPVVSVSVIGQVLKSDSEKVQEGQNVLIMLWMTESYSAVPAERLNYVMPLPPSTSSVPLTAYLGALGMTGMTAWGSFHEIGQPKKGETIFISGAAGSVGQNVGQIALREGLTVIGSVGDERKLEFITKDLGFSSGFNYKKEKVTEALARLAPDGIDIYFDNVGGETLDAALAHMKDFGRIVACGAISTYNDKPGEAYGLKNYGMVVRKRLRYQGFIVSDPFIMQHQKARDKNISEWIAEGSFKSIDHVTDGMDNAIDGFLGMLKGENLGKSILKIADP